MSAYLPRLGELPAAREYVKAFRGLNHTAHTAPDEFYDMENLSSDHFPALAPRAPRGYIRRLAKPNGLFAHSRLCWADGTDFYYDGVIRGQVTDTEKTFVAMGAYVLIWPDKARYHTETGELTSLENRVETAGEVAFTLCRADGSAYGSYAAGAQAPESPVDGDLWVDTSETPNALKQYSALRGMWVSMPTTYVKIEAPGIGTGFAKHDGVTIGGCENESLNGDFVLYGAEADSLVVTGVIPAAFTQSGPVTVERTAPDMDFLAESENRVWGCSSKNHEIYACKQGDPTNWRCYMGVATDSYAVTVGTPGDFTGACSHMGTVLFFKEDAIHKVFGNKPSNYQVTTVRARGVEKGSEKSLRVVGETLYYKGREGVCAYGAALPQSVGEALGPEKYTEAAAGGTDGKYYVCMKGAESGWRLFVLDEGLGLWHKERAGRAADFARLDGTLYCLWADGWLTALDGTLGPYATEEAHAEEKVAWYAETGDIGVGSPDRKYVGNLRLRLEVDRGALVKVWTRYDYESDWHDVFRMNPDRKRSYSVPIRARRCDTMRIRVTGVGGARVYSLGRTIEQGSER